MSKKNVFGKAIIYLILIFGVITILYPMCLTIITTLKTPAELNKSFFALPTSFYLGNYREVVSKSHYFSFVMNSVTITCVSGILIVTVLPMVSYSIARNMNSKGYYKFLYYFFIMGLFIPFQVKMVPLVKLMSTLHLLSKAGLILLYISGALCQGVFLLVGYIKTIPAELEESAFMDGCNTFTAFIKIIYPLIKPMTVTVLITDSLWIWNDFLLPLLMLNRSQLSWTLPLFQFNFKSQYTFDYNLAFASFTLSMLPIIVLYVFIQKHVINGLTSGSVKC